MRTTPQTSKTRRRSPNSAAASDIASQLPSKRGPGRPARTDNPQRVAVLIPGELKRWLRITAAEDGRDMGDIVADALERYRQGRGRRLHPTS